NTIISITRYNSNESYGFNMYIWLWRLPSCNRCFVSRSTSSYCVLYISNCYSVNTMAQFFTQAQRTMGATERINSLLEEEFEEDTISDKDNVNIENENGITFFNVGFSYNKNREILNNINFTAK